MPPEESDRIRKTVQTVVERARHDASFKQQLHQDPVATLKAAGLSDAAAEHMVSFELPEYESGSGGEVQAYVSGDGRCDIFTCLVTGCSWWTG